MVNSKKMSKSSIAVIVLSILLVLSMILGLTGAWFTDSENSGAGKEFTFGTVDLGAVSADLITVVNKAADETETKLLPGSTVQIKGDVTNSSDVKTFYRYQITVSDAGADKVTFEGADVDGWYYGDAILDAGAKISIDKSALVSKKLTHTDVSGGTKVSLVLTVEAIQAANTEVNNAKDAFALINA